MEPQPELVRPYVAALTGGTDEPTDPPEPWPTAQNLPPVPEAAGRGALRGARRGRRRSLALTATLLLAAGAAVALLVFVTDGGGAPRPAAPLAAPAALPAPGGAGATPAGGAGPSHGATATSRAAVPAGAGSAAGSPATGPTATGSTTQASTSPASSPSATDGTLRPGDRGPAVVRLQQLLFQQGFTYVSETGVYDDATTRGVTQLQENRGLTGDPAGVYGPVSRASLDPGD
ncbi:hypothetical protein ABH931_006873 [Streptacidiphilus sp. MAP12-33]|uniref:peptidoglycan-binding domain-containing protein n=1 Tax=Streptacidiphilus sp. MAP12-33 TaxID=3156266 RepID=UPI003517761B